jgi:hypothetical protein
VLGVQDHVGALEDQRGDDQQEQGPQNRRTVAVVPSGQMVTSTVYADECPYGQP